MFKLTLTTVECCYDGYHNDTTISFGKSPKECYAKMRGPNHGQRINRGGCPLGYGGTPVLYGEKLEKEGPLALTPLIPTTYDDLDLFLKIF